MIQPEQVTDGPVVLQLSWLEYRRASDINKVLRLLVEKGCFRLAGSGRGAIYRFNQVAATAPEDVFGFERSTISGRSSTISGGRSTISGGKSLLRQRRCLLEPRVARHALPWVGVPRCTSTPTGLRPVQRLLGGDRRNRVAVQFFRPPIPGVGLIPFGQPRAGGPNPVGIASVKPSERHAGWQPIHPSLIP